MDFNTPNLLLFDIHHASYRGKSTMQCVLLELSLWIFHALTWRSCLPQETARVWASGSRGSHTSGSPTQRSDMMIFFFSLYTQDLILQHFCVSRSVDWAPPTLQVAERAQVLGSGLLAKGCQPNPQQFVGIFAQNRPEVWRDTETSKLFSLGSVEDLFFFLLNFADYIMAYFLFLSALNVCWIYSYRVLPSGDRGSPAQLIIHSLQTHYFNISNCQTKPPLSILCRLVVKDNFLLHQSFWPPLF